MAAKHRPFSDTFLPVKIYVNPTTAPRAPPPPPPPPSNPLAAGLEQLLPLAPLLQKLASLSTQQYPTAATSFTGTPLVRTRGHFSGGLKAPLSHMGVSGRAYTPSPARPSCTLRPLQSLSPPLRWCQSPCIAPCSRSSAQRPASLLWCIVEETAASWAHGRLTRRRRRRRSQHGRHAAGSGAGGGGRAVGAPRDYLRCVRRASHLRAALQVNDHP